MKHLITSFADYKEQGYTWITLAKGLYYPDYLQEASNLYKPYLEAFGQLVQTSESSERLFLQIADIRDGVARVQLARIFRKYVSPETPVEMLKVKSKASSIIIQFGGGFRPIQEVQKAFMSRPIANDGFPNEDAVLAVGLARYDSDRGGAQEDDRIGGYRHCADEILAFAQSKNLQTKVIFLNDGPGLLLGSMWDDYAKLEQSWPGKIMVLTLRMIPARFTLDWLLS